MLIEGMDEEFSEAGKPASEADPSSESQPTSEAERMRAMGLTVLG